jgi:hypothetical protein
LELVPSLFSDLAYCWRHFCWADSHLDCWGVFASGSAKFDHDSRIHVYVSACCYMLGGTSAALPRTSGQYNCKLSNSTICNFVCANIYSLLYHRRVGSTRLHYQRYCYSFNTVNMKMKIKTLLFERLFT